MDSPMWAPPDPVSRDVAASELLGHPIGRLTPQSRLGFLLSHRERRTDAPASPGLWVAPVQHRVNEQLLECPDQVAMGYELTASYCSNGEVVSSPFEVMADADSRALRIKPLGPSLANTFKTLCGVHGKFVELAKVTGLDRVEYLVDQQPMGLAMLAHHVAGVDQVVIPTAIDGDDKIILIPVNTKHYADGYVEMLAVDRRNQRSIPIFVHSDLESDVYGHDRYLVAASVALDANAQMRFRRPIRFVGFRYDPPVNVAAINPLAGVVEAKKRGHDRIRFLQLHDDLVVASRTDAVRATSQRLADRGVFLPPTDPLLVASADAIVRAAIDDVGTRDRRNVSTMFGAAAVTAAVTPFLFEMSQTIAGFGFVTGVALATKAMSTSTVEIGTLVAGRRLFGSGRRDDSPALGVSFRALNIRDNDPSTERVRKFVTAAFLRDDIAHAFRTQLSSLMQPLPKIDDSHQVPGR